MVILMSTRRLTCPRRSPRVPQGPPRVPQGPPRVPQGPPGSPEGPSLSKVPEGPPIGRASLHLPQCQPLLMAPFIRLILIICVFQTAKLGIYLKYEMLSNVCFAGFTLSWIIFRLIFYPYK
eukprot:sb/3476059/